MKKIIRLTESDLVEIVKRVIREQEAEVAEPEAPVAETQAQIKVFDETGKKVLYNLDVKSSNLKNNQVEIVGTVAGGTNQITLMMRCDGNNEVTIKGGTPFVKEKAKLSNVAKKPYIAMCKSYVTTAKPSFGSMA